jgi:hypothetical protein
MRDSRKNCVVWNLPHDHALNLLLYFVEIVATSPFVSLPRVVLVYVTAELVERYGDNSMYRKSEMCHGFELSSATWNLMSSWSYRL